MPTFAIRILTDPHKPRREGAYAIVSLSNHQLMQVGLSDGGRNSRKLQESENTQDIWSCYLEQLRI